MKRVTQAIALLLAACIVADSATAAGFQALNTPRLLIAYSHASQDVFASEAFMSRILAMRLSFAHQPRHIEIEQLAHPIKVESKTERPSLFWRTLGWVESPWFTVAISATIASGLIVGVIAFLNQPISWQAKAGVLLLGTGAAATVWMKSDSSLMGHVLMPTVQEAQDWLNEREKSGLSNYPQTLQVEAPRLWEVIKSNKLVIPSKADGTVYVWSTEQLKQEMKDQYTQKHYDEAMVSIIQIDENGPIGILDRMNPKHRAIIGGDFRKDRQREWARAVKGLAVEFLDFSRFFGIPIYGLTQYISNMAKGTFALPTREFKDALVEWVGGFGRTVYWGFGKEKTEFLPVFRGREKPFAHEDLTYARVSMPRVLQTKEIDGPGGVKQKVSVYDQVPNKELWKYPGGNMHFVARANARRIHSDKNAVVITNADMCDLNCHVAAQHQKPDDVTTLWVRDEEFNDGKDLAFTGTAFDEKLAALRTITIQEVRRVNGKEQVVDVLGPQAEEKKGVDVFVGDATFIKALGLEHQFSENEQAFFVVDFAAREIAVSKLVGKKGGGRQSGLYSMKALDGAIKTVMDAVQEEEGVAVTISDHGGMDEFDTPGHSGADVPFFAMDFKGKVRKILKIADKGLQSDAAPTLLEMMGLKKSPKMTGNSAIREEGYQGRQGVPAVFFIHDGLALGNPKNPNNVAHEALTTGYMPYFQGMLAQAPVVPAIPSAGRRAGLRGGVGKQFEGQVKTRQDVLSRVDGDQTITTLRMIEVDMNEQGTLLYGDPQTLQRPEALRDLRQSPFLNDREFVIRETKEPGVLEVLYFDPTQLGSTEFNLATFGTGQIVEQDILLLDRQFKSGEIFKTAAMQAELKLAQERGYHVEHQIFQEAIKGVHASMRHQYYKIQYFKAHGVDKFVFFASPDGRDENPEQGVSRIEELESAMAYFGIPKEDYTIHVAAGREISYDRAERYDLVEMFLNILRYGSRVIPAAAKVLEEKRLRDARLNAAEKSVRRKPIIGGNWKMNPDSEEAAIALINKVIDEVGPKPLNAEVFVAIPFIWIPAVAKVIKERQDAGHLYPGTIALAAEDVSHEVPDKVKRARTGQISAEMLKSAGVKYVIVGHSERRNDEYIRESSALVNLKAKRLQEVGLTPVVCVGETRQEYESGKTKAVVGRQIRESLTGLDPHNMVVAYEPVWAIGTGLTPTNEEADQTQFFIRGEFGDLFDNWEAAAALRIQYGGSMDGENAEGLLEKLNIGGGLIGGASLIPGSFKAIIAAADRLASAPRVVVAESMNIKELGIPGIIDVSGLPGDEKNAELILLNPDVILVRSTVKLTAKLMAQMPNLKVIIRGGHGTDNIDMEYAIAHGIRVIKTDGSEKFVAALVMRMIARVEQGDDKKYEKDAAADDPETFLTIPEWKEAFDEKTKSETGDRLSDLTNKWRDLFRPIGLPTIHALKDQTVGIIGFGSIGKVVAAVAKKLGMKVLVYSPTLETDSGKAAQAEKDGYHVVSKNEIYRSSNFIVLMTGLNDKENDPKYNKGMIDHEVTEILKGNLGLKAVVNADRGGLVVEEAMAELLTTRKDIRYIVDDTPTLKDLLTDALHTPHIGASTKAGKKSVAAATKNKLVPVYEELSAPPPPPQRVEPSRRYATLDDVDVAGKTVLLRVDINVQAEKGQLLNPDKPHARVIEAAKTIAELADKGAKVVVMFHQGRPGEPDFIDTPDQHAEMLSKLLGHRPVISVDDLFGDRAVRAIQSLQEKGILVLKPVRALDPDNAGKTLEQNPNFVARIKPLISLFVLDGFSVAHRVSPSVTGFSGVPHVAGRLMQRELEGAQQLLNPVRPHLTVVGGGNATEKLMELKFALDQGKTDYGLVGGRPANLLLIAAQSGAADALSPSDQYELAVETVGTATADDLKEFLNMIPELAGLLARHGDKIALPTDMAYLEDNQKHIVHLVNGRVPGGFNHILSGIGPETAQRFAEVAGRTENPFQSAQVMGPLGDTRYELLKQETKHVLTAVSVIPFWSTGGGDTEVLVKSLGFTPTYSSLAGGALAEYKAGNELPGVRALIENRPPASLPAMVKVAVIHEALVARLRPIIEAHGKNNLAAVAKHSIKLFASIENVVGEPQWQYFEPALRVYAHILLKAFHEGADVPAGERALIRWAKRQRTLQQKRELRNIKMSFRGSVHSFILDMKYFGDALAGRIAAKDFDESRLWRKYEREIGSQVDRDLAAAFENIIEVGIVSLRGAIGKLNVDFDEIESGDASGFDNLLLNTIKTSVTAALGRWDVRSLQHNRLPAMIGAAVVLLAGVSALLHPVNWVAAPLIVKGAAKVGGSMAFVFISPNNRLLNWLKAKWQDRTPHLLEFAKAA